MITTKKNRIKRALKRYAIYAIILAAILSLGALGASALYGDWRCAFVRCVKVMP